MNAFKQLVTSLELHYPGSVLPANSDRYDEKSEQFPATEPAKIHPAESKTPKSFALANIPVVGSVVSFLYSLIARPLQLVLLLMTFPFSYFFDYETAIAQIEEESFRNQAPVATDEKTELIKQEKIMANTVKLPTASKYIIPPPRRLFPLLRNPEKRRRRKVLVLDLDETLIHSLSKGAPRMLGSSSNCHMIELKVNSVATLYYVYKRPFCDFFLREISKWFELQIFTASVKEYADPIIDWLEQEIVDHKLSRPGSDPRVFTKRYYRNDCTFRSGVGYIKDLSKFFPEKEDLRNVIILDNSPVSYALHEDNGVMIEGWINDHTDRDLLNLLPLLYSLSVSIDVRYILGMRNGEKLFEKH